MVSPLFTKRPDWCLCFNNFTNLIFKNIFCIRLLWLDFLIELPEASVMPDYIFKHDIFLAILSELRPVFGYWLIKIKQASIFLDAQ